MLAFAREISTTKHSLKKKMIRAKGNKKKTIRLICRLFGFSVPLALCLFLSRVTGRRRLFSLVGFFFPLSEKKLSHENPRAEEDLRPWASVRFFVFSAFFHEEGLSKAILPDPEFSTAGYFLRMWLRTFETGFSLSFSPSPRERGWRYKFSPMRDYSLSFFPSDLAIFSLPKSSSGEHMENFGSEIARSSLFLSPWRRQRRQRRERRHSRRRVIRTTRRRATSAALSCGRFVSVRLSSYYLPTLFVHLPLPPASSVSLSVWEWVTSGCVRVCVRARARARRPAFENGSATRTKLGTAFLARLRVTLVAEGREKRKRNWIRDSLSLRAKSSSSSLLFTPLEKNPLRWRFHFCDFVFFLFVKRKTVNNGSTTLASTTAWFSFFNETTTDF